MHIHALYNNPVSISIRKSVGEECELYLESGHTDPLSGFGADCKCVAKEICLRRVHDYTRACTKYTIMYSVM